MNQPQGSNPFGSPTGGFRPDAPAGGFGAPPPPGGWSSHTPAGFGPTSPAGPTPSPTGPINTTLPVVLGLFASMCACLPGGMVAIALAMMAKDQERRGDIAGARSKITYSYAASVGSILVGLPLLILYIIVQLSVR